MPMIPLHQALPENAKKVRRTTLAPSKTEAPLKRATSFVYQDDPPMGSLESFPAKKGG